MKNTVIIVSLFAMFSVCGANDFPFLPVILSQPVTQVVRPGQTAQFSLDLWSDSEFSVEWYETTEPGYFENDILVNDGGRFQYHTTPSYSPGALDYSVDLQIHDIQLEDQGIYYCVITNEGGVVYSDVAYLTVVSIPETRFIWQALKANYHDPMAGQYGISIRVAIPKIQACHLKGPSMEEFVLLEWSDGLNAWDYRLDYLTFEQLKDNGSGVWVLKLVFEDDQESIYSFTVSLEDIEENHFLPVPEITAPAHNTSNVIAQDYVLRWNPDDADLYAHALVLELSGEDFFYSQYLDFLDDKSQTEWRPGWLSLGNAYAKIGYILFANSLLTEGPIHISGATLDWDNGVATVFLVSGDRSDFYVKFCLDFNEDGIIDLADMAVMFSHWLATR